MALIVEDGSIVANANSYVSVADVRAYATERGITLPADDATLETKVHMAMDWFEGYTFRWQRVSPLQTLSFPRTGVELDGLEYPDDVVPARVIKTVCQATCDAVTIELEPSYAGTGTGAVKKKKLDVMEKEFFEPSWSSQTPMLTKLVRMIEPLIGSGLGAGRLSVART